MKYNFQIILEQIAVANQTTAEEVRKEMQIAMDSALETNDPKIRQHWEHIPKAGENLTLEEFVDYIAYQIKTGQL